jgi:tellurite resistance protein
MEILRQNAKEFREETSEEAIAVIEEEVRQFDRETLEKERDAIEEMNSGREEDVAADY